MYLDVYQAALHVCRNMHVCIYIYIYIYIYIINKVISDSAIIIFL